MRVIAITLAVVAVVAIAYVLVTGGPGLLAARTPPAEVPSSDVASRSGDLGGLAVPPTGGSTSAPVVQLPVAVPSLAPVDAGAVARGLVSAVLSAVDLEDRASGNASAIELVASFDAAMASHDVDAVLLLFTDDAIVAMLPASNDEVGVYRGKEEIRGWLQRRMADDLAIVSGAPRIDGAHLSWPVSIASRELRTLGVAFLTGTIDAVSRDGKVANLTLVLDEESRARLATLQLGAAGLAVAPANVPVNLPRGGEPTYPGVAIVLLGAVMVAAGLVIRATRTPGR